MAPRCVVRRAGVDDLEAVLALMNDPASVHRRAGGSHGDRPENAGQLRARLDEDDNLALEWSGELAGYASWQTYGRHAHLNVMTIAGSRQRQGLGSQLFRALVADLRANQLVSLSLRAYADSPWALAFYECHGLVRYVPGMERELADDGFLRYIGAAMANGQWPAEDKVTYLAPLDRLASGQHPAD